MTGILVTIQSKSSIESQIYTLPPDWKHFIDKNIQSVAIVKRFKEYKPYQYQSMFLICQSFPQIQTWCNFKKRLYFKDTINKHYTFLHFPILRVAIFHQTKQLYLACSTATSTKLWEMSLNTFGSNRYYMYMHSYPIIFLKVSTLFLEQTLHPSKKKRIQFFNF